MKEKNKRLMIFVSILLVGVGFSFAYFVSRVLTNGDARGSTNVSTADIEGAKLKVEGILQFSGISIYPGHQNVSSIKVTATGTNQLVPYHFVWKGTNTLTELNYKVYKTSTNVNVSANCEVKTTVVEGAQHLKEECSLSNMDQLGSVVASGTIPRSTSRETTILVKDEFITATSDGMSVYYYVVLEYPNKEESQNADLGGSFDGEVTVIASDKKADINDMNPVSWTKETRFFI